MIRPLALLTVAGAAIAMTACSSQSKAVVAAPPSIAATPSATQSTSAEPAPSTPSPATPSATSSPDAVTLNLAPIVAKYNKEFGDTGKSGAGYGWMDRIHSGIWIDVEMVRGTVSAVDDVICHANYQSAGFGLNPKLEDYGVGLPFLNDCATLSYSGATPAQASAWVNKSLDDFAATDSDTPQVRQFGPVTYTVNRTNDDFTVEMATSA